MHLVKINKLDYLRLLFRDVYITETIKGEIKKQDESKTIKLPDWIKVEEPSKFQTGLLKDKGFDPGEASAIALASEINAREKYHVVGGRICLVLDDGGARELIDNLKYNDIVESVELKEIFAMAIDKKLCTKKELTNIINYYKDNGRGFKKSDIDYMLDINKYIKGVKK